ncbi:MAG: hypothetical protein KUG78_14930 [Kangiellaceae bacterium]|nr:hypothetical protein [Kangiellaceae bacterium]
MIAIDQFIQQRAHDANISCRTIIITIFGDVVSQHGGWIWLGSLIDALKPLGYSERLVRTSVFRLVKEDWIKVDKIGRRSYYRLTDSALSHHKNAAKRIYSEDSRLSKNNWVILLPAFVDEVKSVVLKRQLNWLGFSSLTSGTYAHPNCDMDSLMQTIEELDLKDSVILFSSKTNDQFSSKTLKNLVYQKWEIESLIGRYQIFIDTYRPILTESDDRGFTDAQCLSLRLLLIHEYRRILLSDHELAEDMLPQHWNGHQANQLVESLYELLRVPSIRFITSNLQSNEGYLPQPSVENTQRFK